MTEAEPASAGHPSWRDRLASIVARIVGAVLGERKRAPLASRTTTHGIDERRTVLIQRPRRELYRVLRNLSHLPRFLDHLSAVTIEDGQISRWSIGDGEATIEWLAQIVDDVPDHRIAWESLPGSDVIADGSITLSDGERGGTVVDIELRYAPRPGASVPELAVLDKLNGRKLASNLLTLRQLIHAGELAPPPEPRVAAISGSFPRFAHAVPRSR